MKPLIHTHIFQRVTKRLQDHWLGACKAYWLGLLTVSALSCSTGDDTPQFVTEPSLILAGEISQVRHLHISDSECANILRRNLLGKGFSLPNNGAVDAVLRLYLYQQSPLRESLPIIKTLGAKAKYRATLVGIDNTPLLSLYGQEGSLSFSELCDDIADELANKLTSLLPNDE